jgi:dTMP kinase
VSLFISFEGGEGSGKSTQARRLHDRLAAQGHGVTLVREPGGTELGEYLRRWLKTRNRPLTHQAELFLFVAARSEVVRRVIRPALAAGKVVITDRYADSTTAYQGYGRCLSKRVVRSANKMATGGLWPSLTVLLDAPPELALARAQVQASFDVSGQIDRAGRAQESGQRRFEDASAAFHQRVRAGFLALAAQEPRRWLVLDASQPEQTLAGRIWKRVAPLVADSSPPAGGLPLLEQ